MVKYSFNEKWHIRDIVYKNILKVLLENLFKFAINLELYFNKHKKEGRLLKITIAKQIYHLTYRELANRKDILETTIL